MKLAMKVIYEISELIHETGMYIQRWKCSHNHRSKDQRNYYTRGIDFAGSAQDRLCLESSFSDHCGRWNNVFVQGTITIQFLKEIAQVNFEQDRIRLSMGTICKFSDKHCLDLQKGQTFR